MPILPQRRHGARPGLCDPPPLKWSDLKYVFGIKEDCYGEETVRA